MAALFEAILVLKTPEECHAFFKDLCTYQELNAISQRLQVAKLLHEGHVFHDIVGWDNITDEAYAHIISGEVEPSGLLQFQMPASMDTVEAQDEDVPRDMECYVDADGNTYDFCFGSL